jgi:hypothetical protein
MQSSLSSSRMPSIRYFPKTKAQNPKRSCFLLPDHRVGCRPRYAVMALDQRPSLTLPIKRVLSSPTHDYRADADSGVPRLPWNPMQMLFPIPGVGIPTCTAYLVAA